MKYRKSRLTEQQQKEIRRDYLRERCARSSASIRGISRKTVAKKQSQYRTEILHKIAYQSAKYYYYQKFDDAVHPREFAEDYSQIFAIAKSEDVGDRFDFYMFPDEVAASRPFVPKISIKFFTKTITSSSFSHSVVITHVPVSGKQNWKSSEIDNLKRKFQIHISKYRGIPAHSAAEYFAEFLFFHQFNTIYERENFDLHSNK